MCPPASPQLRGDLERLDAAFLRLRRLWEIPALRSRFEQILGRSIELSLVRTLRAIESATDAGVGTVADVLHVDQSTASRAVEQAVSAGYVQRTPSEADRRRSALSLTDAGRALLAEVSAARTTLLGELTGGWSDEDVATLGGLLERLNAAIADLESGR